VTQTGTIANFEESLLFPIGTLYIQGKGKKFDVVPCESRRTKQVLNDMFGSTELLVWAGKAIQYNVEDGMLVWIGKDYGN
jgi:hypothetical protein